VPVGFANEGWLNALVEVKLNRSLIPSQGRENSLKAERFTVLVPGPYRLFLLTLPKVPGAGAEKAEGLNHSLTQPNVAASAAMQWVD
jgi:hypothetical protein